MHTNDSVHNWTVSVSEIIVNTCQHYLVVSVCFHMSIATAQTQSCVNVSLCRNKFLVYKLNVAMNNVLALLSPVLVAFDLYSDSYSTVNIDCYGNCNLNNNSFPLLS